MADLIDYTNAVKAYADTKAPAGHTHTAAAISDSAAVGRSVLTAADAPAARTAIGASASISLEKFNVLPSNTGAQNAVGFAAAASSGETQFFLPAGIYDILLTEGQSLMSFVGKAGLRITSDGATLRDLSAYTNNGPLTNMFLLDNCRDVRIAGIKYLGPVLSSPTTLHGYQGATFVCAVRGTRDVTVDAHLTNIRYGIQSGNYAEGADGGCSGFTVKLRGSMIGYPVAYYLADNITLDIDVTGVHRAAYLGGCENVSGMVRFKDQYIADTVFLMTDALVSGTDAAAQADPIGAATKSRGCKNITATIVDTGSTVYQSSSSCAGISLSRGDACEFTDIDITVRTIAGSDTVSPQMGAWRIVSGFKTIPSLSRYTQNWYPHHVLERITVRGIVDHRAATIAGNTGSELYVVAYDSAVGVAASATVRDFRLDGLVIHVSAAADHRDQYFHAPGVASPCRLSGLAMPNGAITLYGPSTQPIIVDGCAVRTLRLAATTTWVHACGGTKIGSRGTATGVTYSSTTDSSAQFPGGPLRYVTERLINLASSGTWAAAIPQGAVVQAVQTLVQQTVNGATSGYQVGVPTETNRYGDFVATTVGVTSGVRSFKSTEVGPRYYTAATNLVLTPNGGAFTDGLVRVILTYDAYPNPTV